MDTEKDDTIDTIKDIATITYTKVYKEALPGKFCANLRLAG